MTAHRKDRKDRKERREELMTPSRAARVLGVARNTVMHRIATQRYRAQVVGGVTFVLAADIETDRQSTAA